ncbi:optic atrophy 3-like protein [Xylariaceae sp. FL0662B]|nr:optic atrophy 3-like protein [Xylariaceae sp. FL0662B]
MPLPLFKLAALFLKHISKYGANQIRAQAHDHPRFRDFATRYGQSIHQLNMRLSVALLRNVNAEIRAKERAEAPAVKTKEQTQRDKDMRTKHGRTAQEVREERMLPIMSVWKRRFRPLPETKAVELFADVVGDAFILLVATVLVLYEYHRSGQKPDANLEQIKELNARFEELAEAEKRQQSRVLMIEEALREFEDPRTKKPLLSLPQTASSSI